MIVVKLKFTRETKNTVRYDAPSEDAPIEALYILKSGFPDGKWPMNLKVTVEADFNA